MEIAELTGALTPSSPLHSAPKLHRELRIRTVHSSLVIEGNTLSAEIVTAIMDGKRVAGPEREICEVRNAQRAYELLPQLDPFSVADLLRAHHTMMAGLLPGAGNFRDKNAGVFNDGKLIHMGTPADYVPEVVTDLFDWMKGTPLHPLLASCIFHYEFEFIHPFADGNGRVGRLWHTLLLSHWRSILAWLPVESVILSRQQEYYASFVRSNTDSSAEAFVTFMLEVIREALIPFATNLSPPSSAQNKRLNSLANTHKRP